MNELIINYFAPQPAIVARLALVPELAYTKIKTPFDIADLKESSQGDLNVFVMYAGDILGDSVGDGECQTVGQKWMVVVSVRVASAQLQDTTKLFEKAGTIIPKVLDKLQGWSPVNWMEPLHRIQGVPVAGYSAAFAYFPFMFKGMFVT